MKIKIDEFRIDAAEQVEAPLDFTTLCAFLAQHQAETPTARLARGGAGHAEPVDPAHPAVAVLLAGPGQMATAASGAHGSFHAAAAARVNNGSR
ncbi:MAG: hypothetical protein ABW128_19920 [Rhizorhabdus sp.]